METAIVSIICIALVVFGGMTMSNGFITTLDTGTAGIEEVGERNNEIMRTELTPVSTNITLIPGADPLEIVLENSGQTKIANFEKWDIFVHYFDDGGDYLVQWLPYVNGAKDPYEWDVGWIKLNGQPEIFDPDVLNPGEQIMIKTLLEPSVGVNTTNMIVISTPSGVTCSTYFTP